MGGFLSMYSRLPSLFVSLFTEARRASSAELRNPTDRLRQRHLRPRTPQHSGVHAALPGTRGAAG